MWIFGYGSLMWDPGFEFIEARPARLHGWHRQFSLRSPTSWGRPDRHGLCLALHRGGSAFGRAFRVDPQQWDAALTYLDVREAGYLRRRVRLRGDEGAFEALTYVHDPANPLSAAGLDRIERIRLIRQGEGRKGSSRFYLRSTVEWLERHGVRRSTMHALLAAVEADQ